MVTSGVFTEDAQTFAKGRNIELIDGQALRAMIAKARQAKARVPVAVPGNRVEVAAAVAQPQPQIKPTVPASEPACPKCGGAMVRRVAKKGANSGGAFLGCASYPKCRGVREV